jgi:carboxyl-terminal processing protease
MKALVLDLRGNPGGSFEAAVECARRFLASGVIVITQDNEGRQTKHLAKAVDALSFAQTIPLVVLIDGNTASSAEILAGALKENGRAELVGQTTFGKDCSQKLLTLKRDHGKSIAGAIRVTVAKFLSPNNTSYSGGIRPNFVVDRQLNSSAMDSDNQLEDAKGRVQKARTPMNMNMVMKGN